MCKKIKLFLLVLLTILLLTPGCSKITKENYDRLEIGMEYSEVITLLGKPDSCADTMGAKSCIWGNEAKNIKVNFLAEKTVIFSSVGIK
jgi:hypothetical protein